MSIHHARVHLRLADRALEGMLAEFVSAIPTDGAVSLRLERPLGLRASLDVEGDRADLITAVCDNEIVGFASRTERRCFVNGSEIQTVGMLGNLRIRPDFRATLTLARGLRIFDELDETGDARFHLAFVQQQNASMEKLLAGKRRVLPQFDDFGQVHTLFLNPARLARLGRGGTTVRRCAAEDLTKILDLHRRAGAERQLFPRYTLDDLAGRTNRLRDLRTEEIVVAEQDGRIVGTLATWSQSSFRRWVVCDYHQPLKMLRPLYNLAAPRFGRWPLPRPTTAMPYRYAALLCIEGNDEGILADLLRGAAELTPLRGSPLVCAVHQRDPNLQFLARLSGYNIRSRMFVVHRRDRPTPLQRPEERVPHIEAGTI